MPKKRSIQEVARNPEPVPAEKPKEKKSSWFKKIPTEVLLSPGGMVLIFFAGTIELIDLIPLPFFDQLWELPLEVAFITFFLMIVPDASFKSLVIPIIIERIPVVSDVVPTLLIKMFM